MEQTDIKSLNLKELTGVVSELGEKPFRAKQIYEWLHQKQVTDYEEMTNISKKLKEELREKYPLTVLKQVTVQISKIDGTRKYLFALADGNVDRECADAV